MAEKEQVRKKGNMWGREVTNEEKGEQVGREEAGKEEKIHEGIKKASEKKKEPRNQCWGE